MDYLYQYTLPSELKCLAETSQTDDIVRSLKWSPDGIKLASVTDDNTLRIYDSQPLVTDYYLGNNLSGLQCLMTKAHRDTLLDISWHRDSTGWLESVRDHPIHLKCLASSGSVKSSYVAYDPHHDTLISSYALAAAADGEGLAAGYEGWLAWFDLRRSGLPVIQSPLSPARKSRDGIKGPLSTLDIRNSLLAGGSYKGQLGIWQANSSLDPVIQWQVPKEYRSHQEGVVQVKWGSEYVLWVVQRRSKWVMAWDVRDMRSPVEALERKAAEGQVKMLVDTDATGMHQVVGTGDGKLNVYGEEGLMAYKEIAEYPVCAVSCHPYYPLIASAGGHRFGANQGSVRVWSVDAEYFSRQEK